jgi:energy-coupling factor transporter ATP-binding protein EcfA2
MLAWLENCEDWLVREYKNVLDVGISDDLVRIRWLSADSLAKEAPRDEAQNLVVEDSEIGWLLFLLPYESSRIERQVNEALGLRSKLLRESNYTGVAKASEKDDQFSSWRVGLVWLVGADSWDDWQRKIIGLRRESGAAEEISFDAVRVDDNEVRKALDLNGLPRLLLHTRAILRQTPEAAETWISADNQVEAEMRDFSGQFMSSRARTIAREMEERVKARKPTEARRSDDGPRQFESFRVQNFRNIKSLEIAVQREEESRSEAIILFGPNGTGKSSLAEALSLAAFGTSPRLEEYMADRDVGRASTELYISDYLTPLSTPTAQPTYQWGDSTESNFALYPDEESRQRYEGIVLNQEDSIEFTKVSRQELAAQVLQGYSNLADDLSAWLSSGEKRANEEKMAFTRSHGLSGAIKRSSTAYRRLASLLLTDQLGRPSPEFVEWLRFLEKMNDEDGEYAAVLNSEWRTQQETAVDRLAETMAKLQEQGATRSHLTEALHETLAEYDSIARRSVDFRGRMEGRIKLLREQLDDSLAQIESWGAWLASQSNIEAKPDDRSKDAHAEIEKLARERNDVEVAGKALRSRMDLLDRARDYINAQWSEQHPDICPVCESDVADRQGISAVVTTIEKETNTRIQELRVQHIQIQERQKLLEQQIKTEGAMTCPIAIDDQNRLRIWTKPFMPDSVTLEDLIANPKSRQQLQTDLTRMRNLPDAPRPYADVMQESERLAENYIALTEEADRVLEDPQSFGEVKKAYEERLERVLLEHLPTTLGKVWQELALALTTAPWLLPERPTLELAQRGKSLSVKAGKSGRLIRYVYNSAERHLLGLAWFFTFYLAKRRFDESWVLLDDPAQEMDQPSFRELVRLWETLLRLHQKMGRPFTLITALHQEDRALDAARATDGKMYILGWQGKQEDTSSQPSVKKVVLLAPGYHPLKSESVFDEAAHS